MSDPLSDALANLLIAAGFDPSFALGMAGILLGSALTLVLLIALEWSIGGKSGKSGDTVPIISLILGTIISAGIGWFSPWIPLFAVIMCLLILFKPFGSSSGV